MADVVEEAGALGCGGAVVYGAGFGEVASGAEHERGSREAARAALASGVRAERERDRRAALARGDVGRHAADRSRPGPVALVSQSGNVAVNALAARRGLRFHTVVSCGNSVAVDPADWIGRARARRGRAARSRSTSRRDGDGALLCEALADCAERGVGVAVLKVGESAAGAAAAAAHTGAVAGDQRVFRALVEEAGAAWAEDVHDLLEIAKSHWRVSPGVATAPRRQTGLGSPSSPARAATRRSPPTSARGSGCGCRRSPRTRRRGCAGCCRMPPRSATRSTTRR